LFSLGLLGPEPGDRMSQFGNLASKLVKFFRILSGSFSCDNKFGERSERHKPKRLNLGIPLRLVRNLLDDITDHRDRTADKFIHLAPGPAGVK
jgi:hypothetical protein